MDKNQSTNHTNNSELEKQFLFDSLYHTLNDKTSAEIVEQLRQKPNDCELLRNYIDQATESGYNPQRTRFLQHLKETYL